jgi:hypothetical protein
MIRKPPPSFLRRFRTLAISTALRAQPKNRQPTTRKASFINLGIQVHIRKTDGLENGKEMNARSEGPFNGRTLRRLIKGLRAFQLIFQYFMPTSQVFDPLKS